MVYKSSFYRLLLILINSILFLFVCTLHGQSLSESWSIPGYQSSDYSEFYGNVYFANSMEEWDHRVEEVLSFSMNQWMENADRMVEQMLLEENGEDHFVSNEGYIDERRRSLYSEVVVLYSEWERQLTEDYFENRNAFLHKLETGKVDALYLQRIGQESLYAEYTEEERNLAENRNRILESAREWELEWGQTRQDGLDSFANSFSQLQTDYEDYIRSLEETEDQFSNHLNAINSYKNTVKAALHEVVSQLKVGLDSSCSITTGCQYKNFDGSYNEAGKIFSRFIGDLSEELNQPNIDPDSILTSISTRIRDFLSNESNQAFSEYQVHQKRIYTYQTGFQIDLSQSTSAFDLASAEWKLRNQTYYDLTNDMRYENWLSGNIGEVGVFSNVYDLEMQGILQSIHNGDYGRLTSIINGKLGDGRRVQSLVSANLYTDAFHFINNQKIGDFYIPFEEAHHTHGNLLLDGHQKYGYWKADRYFTVFTPGSHSFQMGAIGYSVLYEMFDENSSKTSLYWKDNSSQLGGQYNHFQNTLLPAVSHWESKVKEYANTYEGWKENRSNLIAEANAKLEANRQELERSKEEWLQRLEEEKRNGWKSWADLYEAGETKNISTPSLSTWTPSKNLEVFDEAKGLEFQSLAKFEGSTNGIQIGGNGPGLLEEFQRTITGVGQYASVIQMNADLEKIKQTEQQKLINQMTYEMNSESLGGRKLTKEEMILIGTYDSSQLTQEEQSRFGSCYENPEANICKTLLKKAYEVTMDSNNGVLTLKKEIHNGLLAGKNADGQYNAGKTEEVRHIQMSSIGKVSVSSGKDFFTVWNEEDWENLYEKKEEVARSFLSNSLQKDKKALHSNLTSIHEKDNRNQELFLARKESQENNDSLVQELAIAYLTGGAAGMRASLTGKLESAINGELAKAWIQATGGRESDIQMATMAIDFMRGRMSAKKIQSRDQFVSIKNPIQAFESIAAKTISSSFSMLDQVSFGVTTVSLNAAMSASVGITKKLIGERQYNNINEQIAGSGKRLQEIKANEQMIVQNGISMAISKGTGIPTDVISKFLGDKYGQIKAKQANKAMAKNPIYDMGSQMIGAFGGMVKTATVALGVTEDEIQSIMEDTNGILHAGNKNLNASTTESFGYTLQALGMQAGWTKYQSTYLNLRDSKAVVEELGKKALAKELAKSMGMDENGVRQIVDSTYSSQQKQKSDKKAKSNAVRQTVVNAASLAITFGASGALSGMSSVLTKIGKAVSTMTTGILPATTQVGQAVASTFVQTMAGSHEGPKGAMAGFANGVIGGVTQGIGKIQSGVFKGMIPGIGVTYSEQNGWGGSLGIGNAVSNMSVSFSEKGNTTLQASKSLGGGVQLAADVTTNGAANVGFNYNPTGKGPRSDWNFSMMYDLNVSGLSGSIGYTDPKSKLGLTSSIDRSGISTSSELQGVTLGTNSDDGFEIQEMNFAEQNINAAQDAGDTGDGGNQSADKDSPNQDADLFRDFADAGLAFAGLIVGGATLAAGLFSRGSQTTPTRGAARPGESVVFERDRKKEEDIPNNQEPPKASDLPTSPNVAQVISAPGFNKEDGPKSPLPMILKAVDHFPPIDNKPINSSDVVNRVKDIKDSVANYNRDIDLQIKAIKESDPKLNDPQNKDLVKKLQAEKKSADRVARAQEAQIRSQENKIHLITGTRPMNMDSGMTNIVTFEQNKSQKEVHDKIREFVRGGQLDDGIKNRLDQEKQSLPEYKKLKELQGLKTKLESDFQLNNLDRVNEVQFGGISQPMDLQNLLTTNPQKYNEFTKSINEIQKQIDQLALPIKKIDAEFEVRVKVEKYKEMGIGIEFNKNDADFKFKLEQLNRAFGVENSRQDQIAALENLKGKKVTFSIPLFDTIVTPTGGVALIPAPGQGNLSIYKTINGKEIRRPIPMSETDAVTSRPDSDRLNPIDGKIRPHTGTDYSLPTGTGNASLMEGTVEKVENSPSSFLNSMDGGTHNGGSVRIESTGSDPKIRTTYYHLSQVNVEPGDKVKMGDLIGKSGNSGNSGGPHLHFIVEVKVDGKWILQKNEEFDWSGVP